MKLCTFIRDPKSKIELFWSQYMIIPSPVFSRLFSYVIHFNGKVLYRSKETRELAYCGV